MVEGIEAALIWTSRWLSRQSPLLFIIIPFPSECVCSNANPLRYYVLRVPHKADRWRWVVYFQFKHRLGRPHYVWGEYLYSVLEKVEVRMTLCVTVCIGNCVVWDDDRKGEGEIRCRLIACSSRIAQRGPPVLTSPSDGRIAINSTICLLNIHTAEVFGI